MKRGAVAILLLASHSAFAQDESMACIDANADAQKLERAGKLGEAKAKLVACANANCPAAVRADCAEILARVDAAQPTIAVEVRDETGTPTTRARVSIDGVVADASAGRAVAVDPGAHVIVAELGTLRREARVVSIEGEKGKRAHFDFTAIAPARFSVPWLSWSFAGVSLLSGGAFVYFGLTGNSIKSRLDSTCRATSSCSSSEYFDMSTSYTAANVFATIAIGSLAVAVVTALVWPRPKRSNNTASMILHGRF